MSEGSPEGRRASLAAQIMKFAAVGGVGLLVDVGVFNLMLLHPSHVAAWPMIAKTVSTTCAIAVNWVGNRLWAFRERRRTDAVREGVEFVIASLIGSAVSLACLGVSHYLLHMTGAVADNVSANVIGLVAGSAVRFVAYRWWVFADRPVPVADQRATTAKVTATVAPSP